MFQRKTKDHFDVKYHSLKRSKFNDSNYIETQYLSKPIPWKAILLAFFLCVVGTCLLITGSLIVSGHIDEKYLSKPIPWKAILLAFFLCVVGTCLLITGSLIVSGHIDEKYADRMWPLIIIGMLMFPPGAYHIHIAFCAYKEYPGYSFSDIPEFD